MNLLQLSNAEMMGLISGIIRIYTNTHTQTSGFMIEHFFVSVCNEISGLSTNPCKQISHNPLSQNTKHYILLCSVYLMCHKIYSNVSEGILGKM